SGGILTGTPTTTGTYSFTVTVTDAASSTGTHGYTVTINPAVSITTTTLPSWTVNQAGYNQTISAMGGTGSSSFAVTSGALPTGQFLSTSGVLTGTAVAAGNYTFTVTATDAVGATSSQSYTITINPPVAITTTTLPSWTANLAYSQTISATGGTGTKTFAMN